MNKPKRKNQLWQHKPKLHHAKNFNFSTTLTVDECINRIMHMHHKRKLFTVDTDVGVCVDERSAENIVNINVSWGEGDPIYSKCLLTLHPMDDTTTRIEGQIGVVKQMAGTWLATLGTYASIFYERTKANGFSVDAFVVVGSIIFALLLATYVTVEVIMRTRPLQMRLKSVQLVIADEEVVKLKRRNLESEETLPASILQTHDNIQIPKRPNHVPR